MQGIRLPFKKHAGIYFSAVKKDPSTYVCLNEEEVEIRNFDDSIRLMRELGYIETEDGCFGTAFTAKVRLEENAYGGLNLEALRTATGKNRYELRTCIYLHV